MPSRPPSSRRLLTAATALVAVALSTFVAEVPAGAHHGQTRPPAMGPMNATESRMAYEVMEFINDERVAAGVPALTAYTDWSPAGDYAVSYGATADSQAPPSAFDTYGKPPWEGTNFEGSARRSRTGEFVAVTLDSSDRRLLSDQYDYIAVGVDCGGQRDEGTSIWVFLLLSDNNEVPPAGSQPRARSKAVTSESDGTTCAQSGSGTPPQGHDPHVYVDRGVTSKRISGPDRYETAAAIARETHPSTVDTVVIATGENYPDAVVAGPAADRLGGPVLLVVGTSGGGSIPSSTVTELRRLRPRRIAVIGGPNAVSSSVESALRGYASTVVRWSGSDRYLTSVAVAKAVWGLNTQPIGVAFASGQNFLDPLMASGAAVNMSVNGKADAVPVLLAESPSQVSPQMADLMDRWAGLPSSSGGTWGLIVSLKEPAQSDSTGFSKAEQMQGAFAARWDLTTVARSSGRIPKSQAQGGFRMTAPLTNRRGTVVIATRDKFPDALTGVGLVAKHHSTFGLVNDEDRVGGSGTIPGIIESDCPLHLIVLGGPNAVSDPLKARIEDIMRNC